MKISKILAGMSAAALATSMMSMASFAADEAAFKGTKTMSDSSWWTQEALTVTDLIGDTAPEDVSEIKFTADTEFNFGYNSNEITGKNNDGTDSYWKQSTGTEFSVSGDDINWDAEVYYACFSLSKGDGVEYTINWEVYTDNSDDPISGGNTVDLSAYKKQVNLELTGEGRSVSDSGKVRINIKHPWAGDADKAAFNLADDWSPLGNVDAVAITVDISNVTDAFTAYPCFSAGIEGGVGYWDASDKNPAVTVNADGTYTFLVTFDSPLEYDAEFMFIDVATDLAGTDGEDPAVKMSVKSVVALNKEDKIESNVDSDPSSDVNSDLSSDVESKVILESASKVDSKATTSSKAANNAANKNPSTGAAALAAVGVALAGAAVVATKKRK